MLSGVECVMLDECTCQCSCEFCRFVNTGNIGGVSDVGAGWYMYVRSEHVLVLLGHAGTHTFPLYHVKEKQGQAMCGQPLTHQLYGLGHIRDTSTSTSRNRDNNSSDLEVAGRTQVHVPGTKEAFHKR